MIFSTLRYEFLSLYRKKQDLLLYGLFFLSLPILFFIGYGHDEQAILKLSPIFVWISFLLTHFLSCQQSLKDAFDYGQFEQIYLSKTKLENIVLSKIISQWISKVSIFCVLIPFALYMLQTPVSYLLTYILLVLATALYFESVGFVGSCFSESTRQAQALFILIMFPFYIPGFILGLLVITSLQNSLNPWPYLAMISGLAALFLAITPYIAKQIIKLRILT